jgi:isoquinoline 1-oxidoreductase alpha subunit
MPIQLEVNGEARAIEVDADTPLLWVLRDELRLTGTKFGCGVAQCGACTVHVDGRPKRACVTPIRLVAGRKITTIEGLQGPTAAAVQAAWIELDVPQCGY